MTAISISVHVEQCLNNIFKSTITPRPNSWPSIPYVPIALVRHPIEFSATQSFPVLSVRYPSLSLEINKHPAIHQNLRPRHIPTQLLTPQPHCRPRQILGPPQPPQRRPLLHIRLLSRGLTPGRALQILVVELRPDRPRQQRVAADTMLTQRTGRGLHEREQAGVGGGVVGLVGAADEGGDGGDGDDGAARRGLGGHVLGGGLDGVEGAGEVGGEGAGPEVFGDVEEVREGADSGVGDEDVEVAKGGDGAGDEVAAGLGGGDVAGDAEVTGCWR